MSVLNWFLLSYIVAMALLAAGGLALDAWDEWRYHQ